MGDTFQDGIEAAARLLDMAPPFTDPKELAAEVRALRCGDAVPVTDLEEAFGEFQRVYIAIGGGRNPANPNAKGWDPARKKFKQLTTERKHSASAIISGTKAFAATRPGVKFVPAAEAFLNGEQFMWNWAALIAPNGTKIGVRTLFDTARDLSAH